VAAYSYCFKSIPLAERGRFELPSDYMLAPTSYPPALTRVGRNASWYLAAISVCICPFTRFLQGTQTPPQRCHRCAACWTFAV